MKVLQERDSFLSNYEVLTHLSGLKKKYNWTFTPEDEAALAASSKAKHRQKRFTACGEDLEVVTRDVSSYLNKTLGTTRISEPDFVGMMKFLNQFELMKIEKLQIVNSLPRSMVHLYALVEECDQRFNEEVCESIVNKVNELFPEPEHEKAEEAAEGANE